MRTKLQALVAAIDKRALLFLVLLSVVCTFFSVLIPPFQSPDEFDHVKRAYLLSRGKIVLDHPAGQSSGGMIDTGLVAFISRYQQYISKPQNKVSAGVVDSAAAIRWSGQNEYSTAPGTGFYFPVIYAPQAVGLALGKKLGLTVDASYRLARSFALAAVVVLLLTAFSVYPTNPLVLALLLVPMSLFQFSSASLDGVSTAAAVLVLALFLRMSAEGAKANSWTLYGFGICLVLLATSRAHLLPLLLLIPFCRGADKRTRCIVFALASIATLAWLALALKTTVDLRVAKAASTSSIIAFYGKHPFSLLKVLWATVGDPEMLFAYRLSFLGNLGWLDTTFSLGQYAFLTASIALTAVLSLSVRNLRAEWPPRVLLMVLAVLSMLLIFFALLVTWTVHPAQVISGVQGRYFLIPALMIAYALGGGQSPFGGIWRMLATGVVAILFAFAILDMTWLLLGRYYITA